MPFRERCPLEERMAMFLDYDTGVYTVEELTALGTCRYPKRFTGERFLTEGTHRIRASFSNSTRRSSEMVARCA